MATLVNWAGALMSLGLVVGLTLWGYRLAVRDVAGVPVIRALEGPMRVAPENPGGRAVSHQGLAVNHVAAEGTAAPPPEVIALAPRPIDIAETDRPAALLPLLPPLGATPVPDLPLPAEEDTVTSVLSGPGAEEGTPAGDDRFAEATRAALAEALGAPPPASLPAAAASAALPAPDTPLPAVPPGALARSIRPKPRPPGSAGAAAARAADAMAAAAVQGALASLAPAGPREIDHASLPPGTRLVQLGAFPDVAAARAAWDAIATRHGALLAGRDRVLQVTERGGAPLVRLRVAGFADEADARRFCAALRAEEQLCTPLLLR